MATTAPIPLHGIACGNCGLPGYRYDPRTGMTSHVNASVDPCRTKLPTAATRIGAAK